MPLSSQHKRRRKHSRKKNGHRQRHAKIQITKILSKDGKIISEAKNIETKQKINLKKTETKSISSSKKQVTKKTLKK